MSPSDTVLIGSYDYLLVALSVVIAILAAYAALDFSGRVTAARGSARMLRLGSGAAAMGIGIWSMHYIGMLAFRLPIPVRYDWPTVLLSLLAAILASAVALFVVSRERMGVFRALTGSIIMGGGIATMHYVGMEAMRFEGSCSYDPGLVALSVLLAIVIALVALWITFHLREDATAWSRKKIAAAVVMGAAIPVMHYTGMAAVTFTSAPTHVHDLSHAVNVSSLSTVAIIVVTVMVLGLVPLANLKLNALSRTHQLTIRHFMFLGGLSALAILGTLLVEHEAQQVRNEMRVISIASQQRMLSQALTKDALLLERTRQPTEWESLVTRMREQAQLWESSQDVLVQRNSALEAPIVSSDEINRMFAAIDPDYLAMAHAVRALLASAQQPLTDISFHVTQILTHEKPYLQAMQAIVLEQEGVTTQRQVRKDRVYIGVTLLLLGVLLLQGLVVLRPALSKIQDGIGQLERAKHALHRQVSFVQLLQSVAGAANQATSIETAMQFALQRICAHTGWPVGHVYFYAPGAATELVSSGLWHVEDATRFEALCNATQGTRLRSGMGLPELVAGSGKPAWIRDIREDAVLPSKQVALDFDVRGAFAFPVLVQGKVAAVLEFFSHRVEEPDEELLSVMSNVGAQLGQVIERVRAQQEIARNAEDLARSNAELEQFAYVASHDLQEPLRMVASFTQLLAHRYQGQLDAEANEFIHYAVDGAQRMQTLILDLLSYARLSTKGQSPEPIDTASVCEAALAQLRKSINDSDAVVTVDALPTVVGYRTQLTQLFQNLIGNALKYCDRKRPEVHVSAAAAADHWVFSVRDNGIGIEPQYSERIFQMFKRLHTRDKYSGTGIGLALCKKIVSRHRGRIWVESQPGTGSVFHFTIPRPEGKTA